MLTFREFIDLAKDGVMNYDNIVVTPLQVVGNTCMLQVLDTDTGILEYQVAVLVSSDVVKFLPTRQWQKVYETVYLGNMKYVSYFRPSKTRIYNRVQALVYFDVLAQISCTCIRDFLCIKEYRDECINPIDEYIPEEELPF